MKEQVYAYILNEGELGATGPEIDLFLGEGASKHIEELYFDGLIEPGETRDNQIAWRTNI
jgi:hypothetical protein